MQLISSILPRISGRAPGRPLARTLCQLVASAALACGLSLSAAHAQNLFAPAIMVDDKVISGYELQQRERFLGVLRAPGDPRKLARQQLIEDRLKKIELDRVGLDPTAEQISEGMTEFAARANLSQEEFIRALAAEGVSEQTFRDFVAIGLGWREYMRGRFLNQARPSDAEVDRAIGQGGGRGGIRVLLSEIIVPLTPENQQQVNALMNDLSKITSVNAFAQAAAQYSATPTRERGGRMDWLPLANLPEQLRAIILGLSPGEVTPPIPLQGALAVFQLRKLEETDVAEPIYSAIEYATYLIPGGRSSEALQAAAQIKASVDVCDDLYGIAKDQPPERLERHSLEPAKIPQDIAVELAKLDAGEISTNLTRNNGQTLVFLMMCGRTAELNQDASREDIVTALTTQRLNALANGFLQQMQANATIIEK